MAEKSNVRQVFISRFRQHKKNMSIKSITDRDGKFQVNFDGNVAIVLTGSEMEFLKSKGEIK